LLNCSVAGVSINAPFEFVAFGSVLELVSAGTSVVVSAPAAFKTETPPLNTGIEIINAESMKITAAAIVNFDSTVAVPRGPNALLLTLLVNNAPASVLPGCSNTAATSTIHDRKNNVYKTYNKVLNHLLLQLPALTMPGYYL
jgi:hypothetical protein